MIKSNSLLPPGLVMLYVMDGVSRIGPALFAPLLAIYVLALGGTVLHLGEMTAVFSIAYAITSFIVSKKYIGARYSLMIVSYAVLCVYSVALVFTNSIPVLYCVIILGGVGIALKGPPFSRIIMDHVDPTLSVEATSLFRIVTSVLAAIFGYLGGSFIHHSHSPTPHLNGDFGVFKLIFLVMAVFFGISFLSSLAYRARFKHLIQSQK